MQGKPNSNLLDQLVSKLKKNMRNSLMPLMDKILLLKSSIIDPNKSGSHIRSELVASIAGVFGELYKNFVF